MAGIIPVFYAYFRIRRGVLGFALCRLQGERKNRAASTSFTNPSNPTLHYQLKGERPSKEPFASLLFPYKPRNVFF